MTWIEPGPRGERERRLRSVYADDLKDHVIRSVKRVEGYHFWVIGRPDTSFWCAEVGVLYGGTRLLVHGDVDEVLLAGFYPPQGELDRVGAILRWGANSQASYLCEKALFPQGKEWDWEVAVEDLRREHREACELGGADSPYAVMLGELAEALAEEPQPREWLLREAFDLQCDMESFHSIGCVVHHSIIMAQEVLKKLLALIGEKT
jgi:hypothetical protein